MASASIAGIASREAGIERLSLLALHEGKSNFHNQPCRRYRTEVEGGILTRADGNVSASTCKGSQLAGNGGIIAW